ncbi:MAG: TonB-dependent receptor plug domain-containing protein [Gemmatimonadales bacterium]|jgi:TonB-dependent SusC/RagA subfamily outer membrane receptor
MRRSSLAALIVAATLVSACHADKLTGPAAQDAVRRAELFDPSRFGGILIFVDGKEVTDSTARTLDVQSIASVEILKGKSAAALYGDRASAGVIFITTKASRDAQSRK